MATERLDIIVRLNDASKAGSKQVKKNLTGLGVAASTTSKSVEALGVALLKVTAALNKANPGSKRAKKNLTGLGVAASTTSKSVRALGASLLGITAIFAAGRGFLGAINTFKEFDDTMRQAGAVTNATAEEMENLTEIAKEMGKTTRFTSREAAEALKFLGLAGFEATESIAALPGVLQLAAAGSLELGRAADIATNILSAYGFEVEALSEVNDKLVKTFTSSNNSLEEIGEAFKLVGPIAKGLGGEFDDLLAAIGKLGDAGIKASIGGTSLRGTLAALFNPTNNEARLLKELGERIGGVGLEIQKTNGDFIGFAEIVQQLEAASITGGEAMEAFGLRAGPGMQALVNQGSESLFKLRDEIRASEGIAEEIAEKMEAGIGGAIRRLNAATEGLKLTFVKTFGKEVTNLIEEFKNFVNDLSKTIEDNEHVFNFWGKNVSKVIKDQIGFMKEVTDGFNALGRALSLVGFSFTTTERNEKENLKIIKDEIKEILFLLGKERPKVKVEVEFDNEQAFKDLEALKFKIENIKFGFQEPIKLPIFDIVTAETNLKAGLIRLRAQLATESAQIENDYKNGITDLDQYYKERESIVRRQLAKELQLLNVKLGDEDKANKKALLKASIDAKKQELETALVQLKQGKFKANEKLQKEQDRLNKQNADKAKKAAEQALQADKLINNLKIQNSIVTSSKLEDINKNEVIKLDQRQAEELARFEKLSKDKIKIKEFETQQLLEKEILLANQTERLAEDTAQKKLQSDKIISDIRLRNALAGATNLEELQKAEIAALDQRQQEELANLIANTQGLVDAEQRIKDLGRQQELEKDQILLKQKEALKQQELDNAVLIFSQLSALSNDLLVLSGNNNKELFALNQAFAIADATMAAYAGATKALQDPGGIQGTILAGIIVAQGLANVAKIASQSLAEGGIVQGHSPTTKSDDKTINVTSGEYVNKVSSVKDFGLPFFNLVNKGASNEQIIAALANRGNSGNISNFKMGSSSRINFAEGGQVPRQLQQPVTSNEQGQSLNIINIVDPSEFTKYLNTSEGKNAVINVISSKAKTVKRVLA